MKKTYLIILMLFNLMLTQAVPIPGTAYRWHSNLASTDDGNRAAAPVMNDGNLSTFKAFNTTANNVVSGDDNGNAWEAAGLVFAASQTIKQFEFTNGPYGGGSGDGAFSANVELQITTDGTTWVTTTGWSLSPAYQYGNASIGDTKYIWTNAAGVSALGIRVTGQVHTCITGCSWEGSAREIAASDVVTGAVSSTQFAYRWHSNLASTDDGNRAAAPVLNDGNLSTFKAFNTTANNVVSGDDNSNAWEAAGLVFVASQTIKQFEFTNGPYSGGSGDGAFSANVELQITTDGTTWVATTGWSLSPAYQYGNASIGDTKYIWTNATGVSVLGIRLAGQVHTCLTGCSWEGSAREIDAINNLTLAITLSNFFVQKKPSGVLVSFFDETENDVKAYAVQTSCDGLTFKTISDILPTSSSRYSYLHNSPQQGVNYYRISTLGEDGKISYSAVKTVFVKTDKNVQLIPNPATNRFFIVNNTKTIKSIVLFSAAEGRRIFSQTGFENGSTVNVSKLPAGIYIVNIQYLDNSLEVKKLIKQ